MAADGIDDAPSFGACNEGLATAPVTEQVDVCLMDYSTLAPERDSKDVDDELSFAATVDKVQEMAAQLADFLENFTPAEQVQILDPFLKHHVSTIEEDDSVPPVMQEGRRFVFTYLSNFSHCERELILEKWRPAQDTASVSGTTESLTPSITPPGSATPTAVTPREFLKKRREAAESYYPS
eukprot:CAMPEP_0206429486 /NCGR_PEP_ID=MMETSP0324_2-20121206/6266_1 /ASSEMBLY_ACC=CAM_ASM_000836 /TAXON_ID=2866 /ORGANISM="Crypthecodinium cohnii, Strain Seligo" /LENGTH=180 /DNA_ID=CAMNT_0053895169 /DNA_START=250 /DNA_END=789 /DNA_ORIENTATION=+